MVAASPRTSVGGSLSTIERTSAAGLMLAVGKTLWLNASSMSSTRVLPVRFRGLLATRRVGCSQAGWAWLAPTHSTVATAAERDGNTREGGGGLENSPQHPRPS